MTVKNVKTLRFFLGGCVWVFQDRGSLRNSPGRSGTHFVDQASLELTEVHLPECWLKKGMRRHHQADALGLFFFFCHSSVSMNHSVAVLPLKVGQR